MIRVSDKLQLIGSAYLQQVIRILTVFVMARLIGPNDNGIFMLVIYVAGLVMALNDFAIPQSVVQIRDYSEEVVVDTGLVLISLLLLFYGLFTIGAGVYLTMKDPGHDPHYWRIGVILAITNQLGGLYSVQLARINRRLEFRAESRQNIIFAVSTAATGIFFALLHYGSYALALQLLAGQLAANIAINLRVPLSWPRHASWPAAKRFFKLGAPASIASYVRSVEANIIGLIIKPIAGTVGLGLWSKSVQVQQLFGQNLLVSFQRVAYPLVCRDISNMERTRQLFARLTLMLMMVSLLFTGLVAVNSQAIVHICLGSSWLAAAPLLGITAWAIPAGSLDAMANIMCMAMGITKSFMKAAILNLCIFVPAALVVRRMGGGIIGLAICWSAARYLITLATLQAATRRLEYGLKNIWRPLSGLFGSAVVAAAAMIAVRILTHQVRLPVQFVAAGLIGTVVYIGAVWILEPSTIRDAVKLARASGGPTPVGITLTTPDDPTTETSVLIPRPEAATNVPDIDPEMKPPMA